MTLIPFLGSFVRQNTAEHASSPRMSELNLGVLEFLSEIQDSRTLDS